MQRNKPPSRARSLKGKAEESKGRNILLFRGPPDSSYPVNNPECIIVPPPFLCWGFSLLRRRRKWKWKKAIKCFPSGEQKKFQCQKCKLIPSSRPKAFKHKARVFEARRFFIPPFQVHCKETLHNVCPSTHRSPKLLIKDCGEDGCTDTHLGGNTELYKFRIHIYIFLYVGDLTWPLIN